MKAYEQLQDEVAYGFRKLHGRAGVYILRPVSPIGCIMKVLKLFYDANNLSNKTLIICSNVAQLNELKSAANGFLWQDSVNIITEAFSNVVDNSKFRLTITVNVYDNIILNKIINNSTINSSFHLCIFDIRDIKDKDTINRECLFDFIKVTVSPSKVVEESIHSPVEETLIGVTLDDDNYKTYKDYTDYITDSMKIFGNLEVLDNCRRGNKNMNYSPIAVCCTVAANNGWSEDLDMTNDFSKQIDELYNPNCIYERAHNTYSIMKKRKDFVTDAKEKIPYIADICNDNKDAKILIISARAEYAYYISTELNKMVCPNEDSEPLVICGNYHDGIPETIQRDKHGDPVLIKSGEHKGEPKVIGTVKQSSLAMKDFNDDYINILSIKAASDIKLTVDCDIVILTSPLIGSIVDIRRRFQNVYFRSKPLKVYTLYCRDTTENNKVDKYESTPIHEIIRDDENIFVE